MPWQAVGNAHARSSGGLTNRLLVGDRHSW